MKKKLVDGETRESDYIFDNCDISRCIEIFNFKKKKKKSLMKSCIKIDWHCQLLSGAEGKNNNNKKKQSFLSYRSLRRWSLSEYKVQKTISLRSISREIKNKPKKREKKIIKRGKNNSE